MQKKWMMSSIIFIIIVLIVIIIVISRHYREIKSQKEPYNLFDVLSYSIEGKDEQGHYNGVINLCFCSGYDENHPNSIAAFREIQHDGKGSEPLYFSGFGTLMDRKIELQFSPYQQESPEKRKGRGKGNLLGAFDQTLEEGKMIYRSTDYQKTVNASETWTLTNRKIKSLIETLTRKIKVKKGGWVSIPIGAKTPGVVKVSVRRAVAPAGLFLPKGKEPPVIKELEKSDVFLPAGLIDLPGFRMSGTQTQNYDTVWLYDFSESEGCVEWEFKFRDDGLAVDKELEFTVTFFNRFEFQPRQPFPHPCDPWVGIEVSPNVAAVGEPITITVDARAFSGLYMFWWLGRETGIAHLDKAHMIAGSSQIAGRHTWGITIDQPGTYTFEANARDLLWWTEQGVPHQASEGCGIASDTVVVRQDIRKSYNLAFILLAPEGTDTASAEFQGHLNKLEDIKTALISQFVTSTDGMGMVDTSYRTVVLTPPGPVFGISDEDLMWEFLKKTIRDYFYNIQPDIFDFLAIYEVYPGQTIGGRHLTIKTKVAGFGINPIDDSASWGSGGKLRGIALVDDLNELPGTYDFKASRMQLLLHEVFGHQWGVFASSIAREGAHFDFGIESPTFTVMYGNPWRKLDENRFTIREVPDPATGMYKITFHPWILYVAGMKVRDEIPAVLMDVEPDELPQHRNTCITTSGTYKNITLQSVIDESGDRYDVEW